MITLREERGRDTQSRRTQLERALFANELMAALRLMGLQCDAPSHFSMVALRDSEGRLLVIDLAYGETAVMELEELLAYIGKELDRTT